MTLRPWLHGLGCCLLLAGCGESNNPFTGQVSADMGKHHVIVEGCTVWGLPKVEDLPGGGQRFAPCKNSVVVIQGERVMVNGNDLGSLQYQDTVVVRDGQAHIQPLRD
jgi:hypothetical protein